MNVSCKILKRLGFSESDVRGDVFSKRIHDMIYLEYNLSDDFVQLVRFEETVKHGLDRVKITITKRIKTKKDLSKLLNAIIA